MSERDAEPPLLDRVGHLLVITTDSALVRRLVGRMTDLTGEHTVHLSTVGDAGSALDTIAREAPDFVLIDGDWTGSDIPALIEHLSAGGTSLLPAPVIVLCESVAIATAAMRAGAHGCIERSAESADIEQALLESRSLWRLRQHQSAATDADGGEEPATGRTDLLLLRAPVGLALIDRDQRFTRVNPGLTRLLRTDSATLVGSPLHEWMHESQTARLGRAVALLAENDKDVRLLDLRCRSARGRSIWVDLALSPVRGRDGSLSAVVAAFLSTSAHRDRTQALVERNRELSDFAAASSHDLQAPLRTLSVHLDLLREELDDRLDDRHRVLMEKVLQGADRMRSMLQGLLGYLRTESGMRRPQPIDLGRCLDRALANLECEVTASGVQIERDPMGLAVGEATLIEQSLQNLIGNALKHVPRPGGKIRIAARHDPKHEEWTIDIRDNGPGVPPDLEQDIFALFTSHDGHGSGIGLSLCRRAIRAFGGDIWVERDGLPGACFRFTLPSHAVDDDSGPQQLV